MAGSNALAGIFDTVLSTEDKLSKAKINLNKTSPFYSYLVEHLHMKEDTAGILPCPTMGVNARGTCYYNKEYVDKLPLAQLMGVLAHEVSHLALRHLQRCNNRTILVNGMSLWNIAIDISNNYFLVENHFELPSEGLIPRNGMIDVFNYRLENIADKSSEEIYEELKAHLKNLVQQGKATLQGNGQGDQKDKGQGQGQGKGKGNQSNQNGQGSGTQDGDQYTNVPGKAGSFDSHLWGENDPEKGQGESTESSGADGKMSDDDFGTHQKDWDKIMAEAYNHAKMIGKAPSGMAREFDEIHRGKVNWRAILRRTVASKIPFDMTYNRPNKKYLPFDIYMPSFVGESVKVIVSIDTSGSISSKELSDFMSEIISMAKSFSQVEFRVLTHDVEVHDDLKVSSMNLTKLKALKPHGGGGTSHELMYKYIKNKRMRNREDLKLLISFTDGYSSYPAKKPDVDTVFVLAGAHINKEQMPKWGTTIVIG